MLFGPPNTITVAVMAAILTSAESLQYGFVSSLCEPPLQRRSLPRVPQTSTQKSVSDSVGF